jgi:hypothetical protein
MTDTDETQEETQADGYYDEEEMDAEEIDLRFLNDEDESATKKAA